MITFRTWAVYGMLAGIWATLVGWQTFEHVRVRKELHDSLIERSHAKASTCARLMRSPGFSRSVINKERLEAALRALVDTNELRAVELLNKSDEVVASAGEPIEMPPANEFEGGVY